MNNNIGFVLVEDVVSELLERFNASHETGEVSTGVATGFKELDAYIGGLQRGELILVGARPSIGKTSFALSIARNMSIRNDKSVVFFSLERSKEQIAGRIVASEARIDYMHVLKGHLSDDEHLRLNEIVDLIKGTKFIIDDTPGISVDEITKRCSDYNNENPIDLVVIDYCQLIGCDKDWSDSKIEQDVITELKALARKIDAPVMVLSQVSRKADLREDHRPQLTDFTESFSIDQYADMILFLYRDDYYNKDSEHRGSIDVTIAKNNSGPCGSIRLAWIPEYADFRDYVRTEAGIG